MKLAAQNAETVLGFLWLALLVGHAVARPAIYSEYRAAEGDVIPVGSLHQEVRQPSPLSVTSEVRDLLVAGNEPEKAHGKKKPAKNASGKFDEGGFLKTYGSDADGDKGFVKETFSKGDHGYKSFDTFHKQDGDNYGFEKHTAFGKGNEGEGKGHHAKAGSYSKKDGDHEGAGTIVDSHYVSDEGDGGYSEGGSEYSEGEGGSYGGESGESESDGYYSSGEGDGGSYSGYSEGEGEGGTYDGDY